MYRVLVEFYDLRDKARQYHPGDVYPRDGMTVSEERLAELATSNTLLGYPVIAEVTQDEEPKTTRKGRKRDAD